ncbi:hypothetical protein EYF80_061895 [Liparis tanakae]|uniref:Uncharacterized protein n=1 Tax=Liparis tanakae TaxID=230148 RepID=A0A4Z2EG90_9TELE|nr:hypothetical protein EYF80_061895 [Liparis tanakae]
MDIRGPFPAHTNHEPAASGGGVPGASTAGKRRSPKAPSPPPSSSSSSWRTRFDTLGVPRSPGSGLSECLVVTALRSPMQPDRPGGRALLKQVPAQTV